MHFIRYEQNAGTIIVSGVSFQKFDNDAPNQKEEKNINI